MRIFTLLILIALSAPAADAYIGPGVGGGLLATILGIVGAIFLFLFSVIYYPIKRAIRKKKAAAERSELTSEHE